MTFWNKNHTKCVGIRWYRKYVKQNMKEYGTSDPDMRTGMVWGFHSNGAKRGNPSHTCYDCTLMLGYLEIGYTNWAFNQSKNDTKVSKTA